MNVGGILRILHLEGMYFIVFSLGQLNSFEAIHECGFDSRIEDSEFP